MYETLTLADPTSPTLNRVANLVSIDAINSPDIEDTISQMLHIAYGRQGDVKARTMVGLAAPQVGVSKRIIVVGVNSTGLGEIPDLKVFINPTIIYKSELTEEGREGCFSTGHICGVVSRSVSITVRAYDQTGKEIEVTLEGFPARVMQHEIDHLDGIRFPDHITDGNKLHWVETDEFGDYRDHWRTWGKYCSFEKWNAMKSGEAVG